MKCRKMSKGMLFLACGLLAALLVAGCGGSEGDLTVPQVSCDGAGAGTTSRTRYLAGSVEEGATVEVAVGTVDLPADQVHVAGSRWSCEIDNLQNGSNKITVTATDARGNQNLLSFYLYYDALTIDNYTTPVPDSTLTIGGFYDPDLDDAPQVTVGSGTASPVTVDGNHWSYDLSGLLATGDNAITVTTNNTALGTITKTLTINLNTDAPQLAIDAVTTPTVGASQTLTGTWTGDADPVVAVSTATVGTLSADSGTGDWSVPLTELGAGKNAVAVSTTLNGVTATAHTLITQQIFSDRSPHAGAYDVDPVSPGINVTFSVDMDPATITADSFTLSDADGPVAAGVSYDTASRTATLTPDADLVAGTDYTVTLTTDITDYQSVASDEQPLAHAVSWGFTTAQ